MGEEPNSGDDGAGSADRAVRIAGNGGERFWAVRRVLQEVVSEGGEGRPANCHQGL